MQNQVDNSWLLPCADLPIPNSTKDTDHLLWKKAVLLEYKDCSTRHNALIKTYKKPQ